MSYPRNINGRRRLGQSLPLSRSNKAPLSREQTQHGNHKWRYPPIFWDNLSQIHLTSYSLEEYNRRHSSRIPLKPPEIPPKRKSTLLIPAADHLRQSSWETIKRIKLSARHGGPDLSDLRYHSSQDHKAMKTRSTSYNLKSTTQTPCDTLQSKSTGPYDRNFQQHLIDNAIHPPAYRYPDGQTPKRPDNWDEIIQRLARPRRSLSLSRFVTENYDRFVQADADAAKEKQITTSVIPLITGHIMDEKCVAGGIPFTNLDPLTDGTLKPGNPDIYDGARPEQLDQRVRLELNGLITPSTQKDLPICPNFFVAVKGPEGILAVANRQATSDGALGARAMHAITTFPEINAPPDNNAYTITSVYHGGTLKLYTSHYQQPSHAGRSPEYQTHMLRSFSIIDSIETFREGVTAFRNARDWAKEKREKAIELANKKINESIQLPKTRNKETKRCL